MAQASNPLIVGDQEALKRLQKATRAKITVTCNSIRNKVQNLQSRRAILALVQEMDVLLSTAHQLNEQLTQEGEEDAIIDQHTRHLEYVATVADVKEAVEQYLVDRAGDGPSVSEAASVVDQQMTTGSGRQQSPEVRAPLTTSNSVAQYPSGGLQILPGEAQLPLVQGLLQVPPTVRTTPIVQELRNRAAAILAVPDVQRDNQSPINQTPACRNDPSQPSLSRLMSVLPYDEGPDFWIDMYYAGLEEPAVRSDVGFLSPVKATLKLYHGEAINWFEWIGIFHSLVHQTAKTPAEKLAILTSHLSEECRGVIYGGGGDEEAYKSALKRLKETYGRRDVMRAVHLQYLEKLEVPIDNPTGFCRFAERVRGHLIELSRIGESSYADIIERITQRLQLSDRLAWNEGRGTGLERRSLNEFGSWLCTRAAAYQNPHSIAAEQVNNSSQAAGSSNRNNSQHSNMRSKHKGRTHHGAIQDGEGSKIKQNSSKGDKVPFCFQCERSGHLLVNCSTFKDFPSEERVAFAVRHKLCFLCLGTRHSSRQCGRTESQCKVPGCTVRHHQLLHTNPMNSASTTAARTRSPRVALGVVHAEALDVHGDLIPINILFDECSTDTLIRAGLSRRLGIQGTPQTLNVDGVAGRSTQVTDSQKVTLTIRANDGTSLTINGSTMPIVTKPVPVTDWDKLKVRWSHLSDLPLPGATGGQVDVLLGLDHSHLMAVIESRVGRDFEPIASKTRLGWVVRGLLGVDVGSRRQVHNAFVTHAMTEEYPDLAAAMKLFCDTETFGSEHQTSCISPDDQRAVTLLEAGLKKLDVGYEAPILWKEGEPDLCDNRPLAESRLRSLINRFRSDPKFEEQYRDAMKKNFDNGYAVRLTPTELERTASPGYYLPHFGVTKPGSAEIRVVFDGAAKYRGKSLNDAVLTGPPLQNPLPAVIIRFREGAVAWAADIQAMCSRIRLKAEDRRYHRFLWPETNGEVTICEMTRVTFGVSCSTFVAIRTTWQAADDAGPEMKDAALAIRKNVYVDDVLGSSRTVASATELARDIDRVLSEGDFHLQEFVSNSSEFLASVRSTDNNRKPVHEIGSDPSGKVLGIVWCPTVDTLGFNLAGLEEVTFTRIGLASKVARIFDPMGVAAPIVVKGKIRLRELAIRGIGWSDHIDGVEKRWWEQWLENLRQLKYIEIPRCLFPYEENICKTELHTFCDAAEEAYGSVVFIRHVYADGRVMVLHVKGGTKLAPTKTLSIPKLELNAALHGARMAKFVQTSLSRTVTRRYFWTDSSTVRNWIRATAALYQTFVSHRIGEIQTLTEGQEWRFVPGKLNPADVATRSDHEPEAVPSLWLDGPEFLYSEESCWPKDLPWMRVAEEIRPVRAFHSVATEPEFDWNSITLQSEDIPIFVQFKGHSLDLLKRAQQEAFPEEVERLSKNQPLRSSSILLPFSPILSEDGLLRLGGRLRRAKLPYDALHPPLLPGRHPLAIKFIEAFHHRLKHLGTDFVLSHIRHHIWITGGREAVKRVQRDCQRCRRYRAKPGRQLMADLPEARLDAGSPPFHRTAVDYFGPMETAYARNRVAKRWGVLFTCLVTRAVYIDLALSLSSDDFMLVLRRFIALFGKPRTIHSDCGTNFIGAEKELREPVEQLHASKTMHNFFVKETIAWHFQPPATPHFGGAHESLVKTTKRALYASLEVEKSCLRHPTDDTLRTILFEVAGLLNSRPLYYVGQDPNDLRALTPNDFLNRAPTSDPPVADFGSALPKDHYRYTQRLLNLFWDMWRGPYLQSLTVRKKWQQPEKNFNIGDVVLEHDPQLPRGKWRVGTIVKTFPGADSLVRAVDVSFDGSIFRRGIQKLCLLEQNSSTQDSGENGAADNQALVSTSTP